VERGAGTERNLEAMKENTHWKLKNARKFRHLGKS